MPGWTRVEEIVAYRLSVKLRDEIVAIASRPPVARDFDFKKQLVSAAASVPSNISEGFDLYGHGRFGFHVGVAKASLAELKNHLEDARNRGYLDEGTFTELMALLLEAKRTTTGLFKYLKASEAPDPHWVPETKPR